MKKPSTTKPGKISRQRPLTPELEQSIAQLALKHPSSKIARAFGRPVSTVAKIVRKRKVALARNLLPVLNSLAISIDGPHLKTARKRRISV